MRVLFLIALAAIVSAETPSDDPAKDRVVEHVEVSAADAAAEDSATEDVKPATRSLFGGGSRVGPALVGPGAFEQQGFGPAGPFSPGFSGNSGVGVQPGFGGRPGFGGHPVFGGPPGFGQLGFGTHHGHGGGHINTPAPPASCRFWCRSPTSGVYCCESANETPTPVFTKPGLCPPVRDVCPRFQQNSGPPSPCSNDGKCSGIDKCCFDTCLQEHVCKPPRGVGRK
ncbi:WAP-type 'four-disulfide core' domain [Trinorchestia longiramus]|nr:WAP-type 'four-disulfide core' domain [Trinorchestia longiramus]